MELDLVLFTIDIAQFIQFMTRPVIVVAFDLFIAFGWALVAYAMIILTMDTWVEEYKEVQAKMDWEMKLLAIDIPKENIQTPKAVEQIFVSLAGAYTPVNIADKYWRGAKQKRFSFEIVSIEGYIQFLIRTEAEMKELIESSVHAQYPEAEIIEVEDYVDAVPDTYPNDTHGMWGCDFTLEEHYTHPIKTYEEFEHQSSEENVFKDPIATLMENFSKIGDGEQLWFQITVKPIAQTWKKDGIAKVKELIGEETSGSSSGIVSTIIDGVTDLFFKFIDELFWNEGIGNTGGEENGDDGPPNKMQYLTPGQQNLVESIERKINKVGFECKLRGVYVAEKENYNEAKGVRALLGSLKQFDRPNTNSIVPGFVTNDVSYFFTERRERYRKNILMYAYKNRKRKRGKSTDVVSPYILNAEELATLWHFPMAHIKTPMVQKSKETKAEPPSGLPVQGEEGERLPESIIGPEGSEVDEIEEEEEGSKEEQKDEQKENVKFG